MKNSTFKNAFLIALSLTLFFTMTSPAYADPAAFKKGDSSPEIAEAQAALKNLGFFNDTCTGYFGDITETAVLKFQKKYNLVVDGILGSIAIGRLNELTGKNITVSSRSGAVRKDTTKANVRYKISSELSNIYEQNQNVYVVKDGDTIMSTAEDYGVTAEAIQVENNFSVDTVLQIGQEIKIPEDIDDNIQKDSNENSDISAAKGEYLDWFKEVQYIYDKEDKAVVTDIETGKSFNVKRLYGRNHADSEPLTPEDTIIMKDIYGGKWSWDRRAIILTVYDEEKNVDRKIAASMNGMPHGGESIIDNNFKGQFCIHFKNSRTHSGNRLDPGHQKAVKKAAGL